MAPRPNASAVLPTSAAKEDSHNIQLGPGARLFRVGIGVGIGILIAPASGDETRPDLTSKVLDFGDKIRERTGKKPQGATGTEE